MLSIVLSLRYATPGTDIGSAYQATRVCNVRYWHTTPRYLRLRTGILRLGTCDRSDGDAAAPELLVRKLFVMLLKAESEAKKGCGSEHGTAHIQTQTAECKLRKLRVMLACTLGQDKSSLFALVLR
eukprot:906850-Rhodomonas_salina.1